jgi:hypothetical protein
VLLPKTYIQKSGTFDESFFLYYEDTELSFRGEKCGILPILKTELKVFHQHSASTNLDPVLRTSTIQKSRINYLSKTRSRRFAISFLFFQSVQFSYLLLSKRTTLRHFVSFLIPEFLNGVRGLLTSFKSTHNKKGLGVF